MIGRAISASVEAARTFWAVWLLADRVHLSLIAAGVAFYGIFSFFPAIAALIAIFGLVADPIIVSTQLEQLDGLIPDEAYWLILGQINRLLAVQSRALGWTTIVSIGLALWAARAAVAAMIRGLNAVYGQPVRGSLWHVAVALMLTVALIGIAVTALAMVVILPILLAFLNLPWGTAWLIEVVRWVVSFLVLLAGLGLLYRYGPNRRAGRSAWVTPGAFVVIALWIAASVGFSVYLTNFGSYNEVYGSIGAVVAMLMWLYISAYLVLFGAALNAVLEQRTDRQRALATLAASSDEPIEG